MMNPIGRLQEESVARSWNVEYTDSVDYVNNSFIFTYTVTVTRRTPQSQLVAIGKGTNKKLAKTAAADRWFLQYEGTALVAIEPPPPPPVSRARMATSRLNELSQRQMILPPRYESLRIAGSNASAPVFQTKVSMGRFSAIGENKSTVTAAKLSAAEALEQVLAGYPAQAPAILP